MVIAAVKKPHGNFLPLINPETRPCATCGKHFWHETFHRNRKSKCFMRETCGEECRYKLRQFRTFQKHGKYARYG